MKRAPKERKKATFDVDEFIGKAATANADAPVPEPSQTSQTSEEGETDGGEAKEIRSEKGATAEAPSTKKRNPTGRKKKPAPRALQDRSSHRAKSPDTQTDETIRTSFDIPLALQRRLKMAALVKGTSMRDLMEEALQEHLDRLGVPEMPEFGFGPR